MPLAILDTLQSPDLDPKTTFADAGDSFGNAGSFVTEQLGNSSQFTPDAGGLVGDMDQVAQNLKQSSAPVPSAPFSPSQLQAQITGRMDGLAGLNLESLQQAIPANPGASSLKGLKVTGEVNDTVGNLTAAITGDPKFGKLDLPASSQSTPFAEFQQFLTNAGALPVRVLDAILTTFKQFLDKLSHPEDWLSDLSSAALTEIFVQQIQELTDSLPPMAFSRIGREISQRDRTLQDLQTFLQQLDPPQLSRQKITALRQQVKGWLNQIEQSDETIAVALKNLQTFDLDAFKTALDNLPEGSNGQIDTLANLFKGIEDFVGGLENRITTVTEQLRAFVQKMQDLIQQAIDKVGDIASQIIDFISDKVNAAGKALDQVAAYLKEAIAKLTDFVQKATDQSDKLVTPLKKACNQFSKTAVTGIETLAKTIQEQTLKFQQAIENVTKNIDGKLNRQQLEEKIRELLSKVTDVLQSPAVADAVAKAEKGIDEVVAALQKISLDPAFKLAVQKTGTLEAKLKAIDTTKLGTAQKAALKVGTKIIQQVDVPGIVKPELVDAFDAVLDPLVGLVNSVQGEVNQIHAKVEEFSPGTLAANALQPYIDRLVEELNQYKPSRVLEPVHQLYNSLIQKLEVLNPEQLLQMLEDLYSQLVEVVRSLSPEKLTEFLNQQLSKIKTTLKNIPVQSLVNQVMDAIGDVEKLLSGLGIDNICNSTFWHTLEDVLTISLQDKIQQVDGIKQEVVRRVNGIDEAALGAALQELRVAIAAYTDSPSTVVKAGQKAMNDALDAYKTRLTSFESEWQTQRQRLQAFVTDAPPEYAYDYQDLLSRLDSLHNTFAITNLQTPVDQANALLSSDRLRLQPNSNSKKLQELVTSSNSRSNADVIAAFKQVIPNEIETQLTGPIKRILGSLDRILAQPRLVLDGIKAVIQRLAEAPRELGRILKQLATALGKVIQEAIDKLIATLDQFNFNFLNEIHAKVVKTLEALSPMQVLNAFYDGSDFQDNPGKLIQRLCASSPDPVSSYLLAQLTDAQRALLRAADPAAVSQGTLQLLIQTLNRLLRDPQFYSPERFQAYLDRLPKAAQKLLEDRDRLTEKQRIRLNRLLLEAVYPQEITLSLQSIYPLFLEKLDQLYPTEVIKSLDTLHARIIQLIQDFPRALESALNEEFKKVKAAYKVIQDQLDKIFRALIARLRALQSELGIGLEDVSDAYNRLLVALPL